MLKERNICRSGCRINAEVSKHEGLGDRVGCLQGAVLQKDQGIASLESCSQRWFTVRMAMRKPGVAAKRTKAE